MKIRKPILYFLVFSISFFMAILLSRTFIVYADNKAKDYIEDFNVSSLHVPDGEYSGNFKIFGVFAVAKVTFVMENSRIKEISFKRILHSPGKNYEIDIEKKILDNQDLELDAITGATRTSNFAKAAIKNALENVQTK
ncbi:MAG TPA: FMN-binding protein [Bacteroidales bacterium]|nr:FMN-binding protein [Bacteroidales bacterium]